MTKNWQKWPKNGKNCIKNRFSLQQLPWKGHFLKEMHQFFSRLRRKNVKKKNSRLRREIWSCVKTPPRGGSKKIPPHSHTATHPYTTAYWGLGRSKACIHSRLQKFSRLRREFWSCVETPPGGSKKIPPHSHTATHPYTAACPRGHSMGVYSSERLN